MTTNTDLARAPELLPCPFCGKPAPDDLSDTLYPSGIYRQYDTIHHVHYYVGMNRAGPGDIPCWQMNCTQNMGGCGARISADSRADVIAAWNTRAAVEQAALAVPAGWKLVPVALPEQIRDVLIDRFERSSRGACLLFADVWEDLLTASPPPPLAVGRQPLTDDERAELDRLRSLINTPHTQDWIHAVELEAAHQQERWGAEHDDGKGPQDWFWLLGYLSGKALAAFIKGDHEKGLHHIVSSGAVLLNWHRNVTGQNTGMRPGIAASPESVQGTEGGV